MATISSSDLDFNTIKNSLKTYFQRQSEFADYDFDGSGLSNILDVLSYNTHINGLIANLAINESFLNSSQLRSSVVSHAENLGYYPKSKTGSTATVRLTIGPDTDLQNTSVITLSKLDTAFTADVDGNSFTFRTTENVTATNDGSNNFSFVTESGSNDIPIKEGIMKTKTFIVGESVDDQVFVVPDENMDTSTVEVSVFETPTSGEETKTVYKDVNSVLSITSDSTVYIIREAPNGYYEFTFSDGTILGKKPQPGNKIIIKYLSTSGADANDAETYEPVSTVTIDAKTFSITVSSPTKSAGGSDKESLSSIKKNAPIKFASQQRLVTAQDYKALILSNFGNVVQDVAAWSGADNIPAIYGRVYVSLNFKDNISSDSQNATKTSIQSNLSENLSVMSIDTFFTDPVNTFLELTVGFNFDPDLSGETAAAAESNIRTAIINYFDTNLNTFDAVFRKSQVLSTIDAVSPAVLDSTLSVSMQQSFTPTLNTTADYTIDFPAAIANPSSTDYTITSTTFTFNNQTATIKNKLGSTTLQLCTTDPTPVILKDNAGSYNASTGVITLSGFNISAITSGSTIKISATPANQNTIKPLRNYIFKVDEAKLAVSSTLDFQNTPSSIATYTT